MPFGISICNLVIKKQKTQKALLTFPPFLPKRFRRNNLLQKGKRNIITLALSRKTASRSLK